MPAWKDADGGITLCAETEVGIRWVGLEEGEKNRTKEEWLIIQIYEMQFKIKHLKIQTWSAYPLLWLLLFAVTPLETGLETGREFPEADEELEAEAEEAPWALIAAAFLQWNINSLLLPYVRQKNNVWRCSVTVPTLLWTKASHQSYNRGRAGSGV